MKSFRPVLALFVLPALLVALLPAAQGLLLYDRTAIGHGEWWRLWTGHWIHFSASHLAWNLLVLVAAGTWLERLRPGWLLRYTLLAAPLTSLGFLLLAPRMHTYGGLSGLAAGVVTLLALVQLACDREARARWVAVLLLVALKAVLETGHNQALFSNLSDVGVQPSALAHAAGAGLALAFFLSPRRAFSLPLGTASVDEPEP